jgi:hypothetical protein
MRVCGGGWWRGLVRLCGFTISKLAWYIMHSLTNLERELDRIYEGKGYSEGVLRATLHDLEYFSNVIRFAYPACPVLRDRHVIMLKQDIAKIVDNLRSALDKGDVGEVQMALLEATPEVGAIFLRLHKHFIEI